MKNCTVPLARLFTIEENQNFYLNSGSSNLHCINANCKSLSLFVRVNFRKIIITLLLHPSLVFIHHKTVFTELSTDNNFLATALVNPSNGSSPEYSLYCTVDTTCLDSYWSAQKPSRGLSTVHSTVHPDSDNGTHT